MDKNKAMSGYEKIFDDGYKAGRASVVLPHPCDGPLYKTWMARDYFLKINEEFLEVVEAYYELMDAKGEEKRKEAERHFMRECTDLKVIVTSLMQSFGCGEEERQKYMKEVNESNAKRDGGKRFADTKKEVLKHASEVSGEQKYFEIGEIVEVDGPVGKETGFILDESRNRDGYIVSIDGVSVDVPAKWVNKVEEL
jgi:hypothetical protein